MENTIFSFPPIVNEKSRILILGTMPGKESLRREEYYAHPQNAFWPIIFTLLGEVYSDNYQTKRMLLLENGIALWDVLKACERNSSLDSDILVEKPNNFDMFFATYPNIQAIFFNGQSAARFFKKYVATTEKSTYILPSTSPAHTLKKEAKLSKWKVINDILG